MTALTALTADRAATAPTRADRLRRLLLADAALLAAIGVALLLAAEPVAEVAGSPGAVRVVGAVLLVLGADVALLSGWAARRLAARTHPAR